MAAVDIVVNLADSPDPMPAGGQLTYILNIANNGPDDATGVQITDVLPAGVSLVSVTPAQGSCSGTTTITCQLGNLDNNASANISIVVTVPTTAGTLVNNVTSTRNEIDTNATNNSASELTTVVLSSNLRMTKTDTVDPASQGQSYDYRLIVRNLGPNPHPNTQTLSVTDNIPLGMRLRSVPTGTGWSCSSSAGTVFPQNGPLTVTCSRAVSTTLNINTDLPTISVPVLALASGTVVNEATVSSTMPDNDTSNNTALQPTSINQAADLAISKTIPNGSPLGAGQTYTYTLTPSLVVGETAGATLTVTDPLPVGIQVTTAATVINSQGTWSCQYNPAQSLPFIVSSNNPVSLSCSSSSNYINTAITPLSLAGIQFSFQPQQGGTLVNSATVAITGLTDPVASNNSASVSRTVNAGADLEVIKTSSGSDTKPIGTSFQYFLDYRNLGTATVPVGTTVTLTDQLPAGVRVDSISTPAGWTCPATPINGAATITCTRSGLVVSSSTARITLNVTATSNGTKLNTAAISSPLLDTNTNNNQSSKVIEVFTPSGGGTFNDLSIIKQDTAAGVGYGPDPVALSGLVKYRLRLRNNGPSSLPNGRVVTVTDSVPFNASFVSATALVAAQGWSCSYDAGLNQVSCSRTINTSVAATQWNNGTTNDIDVVLRAVSGTSMTNTAQVSTTGDPVGSNNIASEATAILTDANLKLIKTVSTPQVLFGQNFTYTFTVENLGSTAVPVGTTGAIRLIDDMRPNPDANHISNTGAANGWSCVTSGTGGADPLICDYQAGLAVGAATSFSVTVQPRTVGMARSNTADVSFQPTAVVADPDFANNSSTVLVDVLPAADVQLTKTASLASVAVGQNLTYILTIRNNGPNTATNVTLIDQLPAAIQVLSVTPTTGGVCNLNTPAAGQLQCVWASLGNNVTQSVSVVVRPTAAAENTSMINTATVTAAENDLTPATNLAAVTTTVTPALIDLVLNKTDQQDPVPQSGVVVYELRVTNLGPSVATSVVLTENLPHTVLGFISATPQQGACAAPDSNHVMSCALGNLEAGQTVLIRLDMSADIIGTDTNTATVSANETDPTPASNSANESTTVQLGADVSVIKSVTSPVIVVGEPFVYQLAVINAGPANSIVTLTDVLDSRLLYQSASTDRGSCSYSMPTLTCSLGLMATGQNAQILLTVVAQSAGTLPNQVVVAGTAPEINPANNQSAVDVASQIRVAGRVFIDNAGTSGVFSHAYNGTQEGGEIGLPRVSLQLTDCSNTVIATTLTDAGGDYQFLQDQNLPAQFCVQQTNLAGYSSVSGQLPRYNRLTDRYQITSVLGQYYDDLDFGDAQLILALTANGQKTTTAGGTVNYPHRLSALTALSLTGFTLQNAEQPVAQGWTVVVYDDGRVGDGLAESCNGQVDSAEQPVSVLTGTLLPTDERCFVLRVNAPAQASGSAQHVTELFASYEVILQDLTQVIGQSNPNTDSTLVGTGGLQMTKQVRTVATCPSTAADQALFVEQNIATAGDFLEYQIIYRNTGTTNISRVRVRDAVPHGTSYQSADCQQLPSPAASCQVETQPAVAGSGEMSWLVNAVIAPAQSGSVRFCVQVPELTAP